MQERLWRYGTLGARGNVKKLTVTSHAILSLLTIRPWSGYELAKQMHRTVGMFWPRAERGVYDEPRNLVAHGLATATDELVGARPRTVYEITDRGRAALREWLGSSPIEPLQLESEAVLRVTFGENGTSEQALATLQTMRDQLADQAALIAGIARQYVDGEGPFPQRCPPDLVGGAVPGDATPGCRRVGRLGGRSGAALGGLDRAAGRRRGAGQHVGGAGPGRRRCIGRWQPGLVRLRLSAVPRDRHRPPPVRR